MTADLMPSQSDAKELASLFDAVPSLKPVTENSADRFEQAKAGSPEEKARYVLDATIVTEQVKQGTTIIDAMIRRGYAGLPPRGFCIVGDGGLGKSFLLKRFLKRYPPQISLRRSFFPIVSIQLDAPVQLDVVARNILLQLGYGGDTNRPYPVLWGVVHDALRECRSIVLMVDEAQKMGLTKGMRNHDRAAGPLGDQFKSLTDNANVGLVFAGTEGLSKLFDVDHQLRTRWPGRVELAPFNNDQRWLGLLDGFSRLIPLPKPSNLVNGSIPASLHKAARGHVRELAGVLSEATYQAARDGAQCLNESFLNAACLSLGYNSPFKS